MKNVKMQCSRAVVLVLVVSTLAVASPVPPGTSTARYSFGGHTTQSHLTLLPQFSDSAESISINRNAKMPTDDEYYEDMILKILTQTAFDDDGGKKLKKKDQKLFTNFVTHNIEDLNTPNKTFKINSVKISTVNSIRVASTTPRPRKSSTRKPSKRVPSQIIANVTKAVKVSTTKRPLRMTLSTNKPFKIKLTKITTTPRPQTKVWPNTPIKDKNDLDRYKNYTRLPTTKRSKTKPTIRRVITKWSDNPNFNEIKQNWYEEGVPYPSPNPEISSYSPPVSISDVVGPLNDVSQDTPAANPQPDLSNAVSTFNLDMAPESDIRDGNGSPCPTVHISSAVLTPQQRQRQDCSDLNLVINSHFHQNTVTDRSPPIQTYDQAQQAPPPAEDPPAEDPGGGGAGSSGGGAPQAAAPAAPSQGGGGTGGSGGSGGSGGDGGDHGGGLQLPDLKGLFDLLGKLWQGIKHLLEKLKNPWLYIIPIALSFLLGFLKVMLLFPWWIPGMVLLAAVKNNKTKPKPAVYTHVHKPVHHHDGWFWNHDTKTWQNLADYHHYRRSDSVEERNDQVSDAIDSFSKKYKDARTQSWKWRRRRRR